MVLMREQDEQNIDDSVGELSGMYCEVIALYYYDGKTYAEISEELDIPVETVRTRLRRAREQLRKFLGEEDAREERELQGGEA